MKLVIIGAGVAGLIANYVASQHRGIKSILLESGRVGGEWLSGGFRYIHATEEMASMLIDIGATFSSYTVDGGILLHQKVQPFPEILRTLEPEHAQRVQHDHWRKTRQCEPDPVFGAKSMNDPEAVGARTALRCDTVGALRRLSERAIIFKESVLQVLPGEIRTNIGSYEYDYIIWTAPLWTAKQVMFFALPDALAMRLNIVVVSPQKIVSRKGTKGEVGAIFDPYSKWDYIYTPYTPDNLIHRISAHEDGYSCEFNGDWPEGDENITLKLTSDLNFLFPNGWSIQNVVRGVNGHLLPLLQRPEWPPHIQPLGRFAQWDSRATADVVLRSAFELGAKWGWSRYDNG